MVASAMILQDRGWLGPVCLKTIVGLRPRWIYFSVDT